MPKPLKYALWMLGALAFLILLVFVLLAIAREIFQLSKHNWGDGYVSFNPFYELFRGVPYERIAFWICAIWVGYLWLILFIFTRRICQRGGSPEQFAENRSAWRKEQFRVNRRQLVRAFNLGVLIPIALYLAPVFLLAALIFVSGENRLWELVFGSVIILWAYFLIYWGVITFVFIWGLHAVPVRLMVLVWDLRCPRPASAG